MGGGRKEGNKWKVKKGGEEKEKQAKWKVSLQSGGGEKERQEEASIQSSEIPV